MENYTIFAATNLPVMKRLFYLFVFTFSIGCATTMPPASDWVAPGDEQTASVQPDSPARFKGGDIDDFRQWVVERTTPLVMDGQRVTGRVVVKFVVEKDGSIGAVEITQSPHKLLGKKVVRVLRRSPKWTPARQGDRLVRQMYVMPVIFR